MSQPPDDRAQGDRPDPDPDAAPWWPDDNQDLHPAIDPREDVEPHDNEAHLAAPPVDIDERENASDVPGTPDVIELEEHVDTDLDRGGPDLTTLSNDAEEGEPAVRAVMVDPDDETTDGPPPEPGPAAASSRMPSFFAGAASRLGLGKPREGSDETGKGEEGDPESRDEQPRSRLDESRSRFTEGVRSYLDPRLHMPNTIPHRRLVAVGLVLIVVCLLANSGGLALIVLSALVPLLIVITLTQHDVFEKESNLLVAAVGAGGAVVGIVLGWIATWVQSSQWFDTGVLNFGAAGFGGRFADAAGSAPFIVWSMVGLVIPAAAIAGIAGIPIAMRRWPQFRNEVMDGMILAGAAAAGFSIGASLVYWWPMIAGAGPRTNVSDWTLSIIGVSLVRPAVITLCGAMIGAGIWRYMITPTASAIVLPAVGGVAGYLLLTFGSIQLQPSGNWPEFLWAVLLLAAVFVLYRRVLDGAVQTDRQALGEQEERLVCPSCHKVTPAGAFCARCGGPLPIRVAPDQDRVRVAGEPQEKVFDVHLPYDRTP